MGRAITYRVTLLAALALLATQFAGPASARVAGKTSVVAPTQRLAALLTMHTAYAKPDKGSKHLGKVLPLRPITAEQTFLPVLAVDGTGEWLKVLLPGRPEVRHAHTGWIDFQGTVTHSTDWHLVIRTGTRRVIVYHSGHVVRSFLAIVGKPSTPTPHGEFFVEESIKLKPTDIGAPFALALSARSAVFQEFLGGPGQVALHGLDNVGGVLGTAVSHGCVRLADDSMRWLVTRIGPGTPVTIKN
jgi:hypothetical protein